MTKPSLEFPRVSVNTAMTFRIDAHVEFSRCRFPLSSSAPIDLSTTVRPSVGGRASVNVRLYVRGHECRNRRTKSYFFVGTKRTSDFYLTSITANRRVHLSCVPDTPASFISNSARTSPGSRPVQYAAGARTAGFAPRLTRRLARGSAPLIIPTSFRALRVSSAPPFESRRLAPSRE